MKLVTVGPFPFSTVVKMSTLTLFPKPRTQKTSFTTSSLRRLRLSFYCRKLHCVEPLLPFITRTLLNQSTILSQFLYAFRIEFNITCAPVISLFAKRRIIECTSVSVMDSLFTDTLFLFAVNLLLLSMVATIFCNLFLLIKGEVAVIRYSTNSVYQ